MSATENAIDDAIRAHFVANEYPEIITGWAVLVATTGVDDDGEEISGVNLIYPGGSMSWPMALGIIEAGRIRMHSQFSSE